METELVGDLGAAAKSTYLHMVAFSEPETLIFVPIIGCWLSRGVFFVVSFGSETEGKEGRARE